MDRNIGKNRLISAISLKGYTHTKPLITVVAIKEGTDTPGQWWDRALLSLCAILYCLNFITIAYITLYIYYPHYLFKDNSIKLKVIK